MLFRLRIPFERALDFANKEKITELLYPLFVHNIGALLYHPTNQTRTTQVMQAAERRKAEQQQRGQAGLPSIHQQQHHPMMAGPGQQQLPSQGSMSRTPMADSRPHSFPTPPASASGVMQGPGMGGSEFSQWPQSGMNGAQGTNPPMSIDTTLSNSRSMPATPATTPPGPALQSMQYPPASQPYDNGRPIYNAPPPQQSPYSQSHQSSPQDRPVYGQPGYVKSEMGPPTGRSEHHDSKPNGYHGPGGESHATGEEEAEHEHDGEYTHDSGAYDATRTAYNYNAPPVQSLPSDHSQMAPDMAAAGGHQGASGRSTPRSAAAPQSYYSQDSYASRPSQGTMYNVVSNERGPTNGASQDAYAAPTEMGSQMQNGYPAPALNGSAGIKRSRDDDDERPSSVGPMGGMDMKRRKTGFENSVPSPQYAPMQRPASAVSSSRR